MDDLDLNLTAESELVVAADLSPEATIVAEAVEEEAAPIEEAHEPIESGEEAAPETLN